MAQIQKKKKYNFLLLISFSLLILFTGKAVAYEEVTLQLRWGHQFQFAGYYTAVEKGFYKDVGLDVQIVEGGIHRNTMEEVLSNRAQYGASNSEILFYRLQNKPLVVIAAIYQHSPLVLVSRREMKVDNPHSLIGKRVKMTRDSRDIELHAMFVHEGIELDRLQIIDGNTTRDDYFNQSISAVSSYITNEPYYYEQLGIPYNVISPRSYGIDFYGDCLFTSEQEIKNHPERVAAFRKASLKGWEYAMSHTDEIIRLILAKYNSKKTYDHLKYEAKGMKKLILPDLVEMGHMNPDRWQRMAQIYRELGFVSSIKNLKGFIYSQDSEKRLMKQELRILGIILGAAGLLIVIGFLWVKQLRHQVNLHTRELRESEDKFKHIFNYSIIGKSITYLTGEMETNRIAYGMLGYSKDEFSGLKWQDITHPDDFTSTREIINSLLSGKRNSVRVTMRFLHKNGSVVWADVSTVLRRDSKGVPLYFFSEINDITDRKKKEEKLIENKKNLQLAGQLAKIGYWSQNLDLDEATWSAETCRILGLEPKITTIKSTALINYIHPEDLEMVHREIKDAITGIRSFDLEFRVLRADGAERWIHSKGEVYSGQDKSCRRFVGMMLDITEGKLTEKAIWEYNQRLKALREMELAILEIQSPVAIAQKALSHIQKLIPCFRSSVVTIEEKSREARVLVMVSKGETHLGQEARISMDVFGNMAEFANGKVNIVEDLQCLTSLSPGIQALWSEGIRSYINIPIVSRMGMIGSLNLGSDRPEKFSKQEIELASEVAASLGVALQNARLLEETEKQRKDLKIYSTRLIMAQEEERKKIALELHDEVGQSLTAICFNLDAVKIALSTDLPASVKTKIIDTVSLVEQVSDEIHELSLTLRPSMLDELGLVPSLKWLLRKFSERSNIRIEFKADEPFERLPSAVEINLYRIVQEAVNNLVKHADASTATVSVKRKDNTIRVVIQDDGKGFHLGKREISNKSITGIGLISINERAAILGGEVDIRSRPGQGTEIIVFISV